MDYQSFIKQKAFGRVDAGFTPSSLNPKLKPHQSAIVNWACQRGRAAIFADTGLGKSFMQLEWAERVAIHAGKPVLLLAPLAVGKQTEGEAVKFELKAKAKYTRQPVNDCDIVITNYEMLDNFDPSQFSGIVLDESSILKGQSGAYRKRITEFARHIDYRLSCTATPSPNDFMELGTQAEFLGIMSQSEMLSMFFTHDGSETQKWRLKGHGAAKFWDWMATWSVVISSPSDLGFDGKEYELPPLTIHEVILPSGNQDQLIASVAMGLGAARDAKRSSIARRCNEVANLVNSTNDDWLIWGELNAETDLLSELIENSVQVQGADKIETKEDRLLGFASGKYNRLISKSSICGFGMNWQRTNKMAFVGPTYSFEQFYQAVRRQWRFGQVKPVDVYVFMTEEETGIHAAMLQKMEQDKLMRREMVRVMSDAMKKEITGAKTDRTDYNPITKAKLPSFI